MTPEEWACEVHFFEEPNGDLNGLYEALLFVLKLAKTQKYQVDVDLLIKIHSIFMRSSNKKSRIRRPGENVFAYKLNHLTGKADNKEIVTYTPGGSLVVSQINELLCRTPAATTATQTIAQWLRDFLLIHPFTDGNGRMAHLLWVLFTYNNHNKTLTSICNYNFPHHSKQLHLNARQIYIIALQNDKFFTEWVSLCS